MGTSIHRIQNFLATKEKWIEKHLQKFELQSEQFPEKQLKPGERFLLKGEKLKLVLVPTPLDRIFFSVDSSLLRMHMPQPVPLPNSVFGGIGKGLTEPNSKKGFSSLQDFYRREAERSIPERVNFWAQKMSLLPKQVHLRNQKTRWGSCSSRGSIQINWRLIAAPPEVLDYVIVHELSHLQHMNHSSKFWQLVEKYQANFQSSEKWLKENKCELNFLSTT